MKLLIELLTLTEARQIFDVIIWNILLQNHVHFDRLSKSSQKMNNGYAVFPTKIKIAAS